MSVKCSEVIELLEKYAPPFMAEEWDNVGLMVGRSEKEVGTVLVALDINDGVIDEAIEKGADLIVTHHPFIFRGIKNVNDMTPLGRRIIRLIRNDIAVYSAHTNLDCAEGGTNATLAELLSLSDVQGLYEEPNGVPMGRMGNLDREMAFGEFISQVKKVLGADRLSVCGDMNKKIKRVGICTGKGASFMSAAKKMGADVFITGDFGYHEGQSAQDMELCVIDGTHYLTEVLVVPVLCEYIKNSFIGLNVIKSEINGQTLNIV